MLSQTDKIISDYIINLRTGWLTDFFVGATWLGDLWPLFFLLVVFVLILLYFGRYLAVVSILLGVFFVASMQYLIKLGIARLRPDQVGALIRVDGYSFPSGHASITAILFLLLAYYFSEYKIFRTYKSLFYVWASFLVLAVAMSRVYLGVHWTSDIIAGLVLGIISWGFFIWLFPTGKLKSSYN